MPLVAVIADISEQDLTQLSNDIMAAKIGGWNPVVSDPITALLEGNARVASILLSLLQDIPDDIAFGIGEQVFGLLHNAAAPATATARFTLAVAPGGANTVTIPSATNIGVVGPDGQTKGFRTTQDLNISGALTQGDVLVTATELGTASNNLSGSAFLLDGIKANVSDVDLTTTTINGEDEETIDAYLPRLRSRARLLTLTPILPQDFADLAMEVPTVDRAMGIDLYDPVANTYGHTRMITVPVMDATGAPASSGVKTAVHDLLVASRELGWTINVIDPVYTPITVVATVKASPGVDHTALQADVIAGLTAIFDPANWGGPTGDGQVAWTPQPVVKVNAAIIAAGATPGVQDVTSVTLNGAGVDITMNGGRPHALPQLTGPPTVTVT